MTCCISCHPSALIVLQLYVLLPMDIRSCDILCHLEDLYKEKVHMHGCGNKWPLGYSNCLFMTHRSFQRLHFQSGHMTFALIPVNKKVLCVTSPWHRTTGYPGRSQLELCIHSVAKARGLEPDQPSIARTHK